MKFFTSANAALWCRSVYVASVLVLYIVSGTAPTRNNPGHCLLKGFALPLITQTVLWKKTYSIALDRGLWVKFMECEIEEQFCFGINLIY